MHVPSGAYYWAITLLWASLWACVPEANEVRTTLNHALVFIKPHANTAAVASFVRDTLAQAHIRITGEGEVTGDVIDQQRMFDRHYAVIARYALEVEGSSVRPTEQGSRLFKERFGISWENATALDEVLNIARAEERAPGIAAQWDRDPSSSVRLCPGAYTKLLRHPNVSSSGRAFVINGFYPGGRAKFTAPDARVRWFTVAWDEAALTWADFRGKVIGPTSPEAAPAESMRGAILARWQELGLTAAPNVSDNGVHASAGPLEGVVERGVWLGAAMEDDPAGAVLLAAGVSAPALREASTNPVTTLEGRTEPIFDILEDRQTSEAIPMMVKFSEALEPSRDTAWVVDIAQDF